jgi:DNA-binding NtrC family response regulator
MGALASIALAGRPPQRSARIARLYDMADRIARTDASVLLSGESGTGKGTLARYLHDCSCRHAGPFVTIACANIPGELLESELFGHEKGAFTGATERRIGRFEMAHGGTILIDGVSELAPGLQAKLLRIVQERSFERLAGTRTLEVDVRILSSTQVDVEPFVESGQFRKDLYYRLNVIRLDLPPLREHLEDLPDLADECLRAIASQLGEEPRRLSPGALGRLMDHDWPGNLRELQNVLESSVILDDRREIPAEAIRISPSGGSDPIALATLSRYSLAQLEEMYIRATLRVTRGNRTEAARILGINRKTLLEKRKRYGIP